MTLIAGMQCREGVVIAADTEHTDGVIRFSEHKLIVHPSKRMMSCHLSGLASEPHRVVIAGAGFSDYIKMTADDIIKQIDGYPSPSIDEMSLAVKEAVRNTHDVIFRHWDVNDQNRPTLSLFVGIRSGERTKILRTQDVAISEVETLSFAGTGEPLARYLAKGLYRRKYPASVVLNIIIQVFRAVKESGAYVGGSTELCVLGKGKIFHLPGKDGSYLWGIQKNLERAIRVSLLSTVEADPVVDHWIDELVNSVKDLRKQRAEALRYETPFDDWLVVEGDTNVDDPLEDTW
jgi:20S proteasome alpha/beta subunit